MTTTLQFPGQGKFRSQSQRRFVLARWSLHYDRAEILQRSDTLRTLTTSRRRHQGTVIFDTTTGQAVA